MDVTDCGVDHCKQGETRRANGNEKIMTIKSKSLNLTSDAVQVAPSINTKLGEPGVNFDVTNIIKETAPLGIISSISMIDNRDETDRAIHIDKNTLAKSDVNNKMSTENATYSFKSPLPYKPDQWAPDRPDGRKIYDRDFLLALKNHPASQQKPKNILEDRFYFGGTTSIKDTAPKAIVSPIPKIDHRDKTDRAINDDKNILAKSDVNNMSTENVIHSFKSPLPYEPDQWAPNRPGGRKIYDRDFLLALRNHPTSQQKTENILKPSRCFEVTSIIKDTDPKVIVSPLPMSHNRDKTGRAIDNDKHILAKSDVNNKMSTENVIHCFKSSLPYKPDQWAPDRPDGRKIYDRDFLLALKNHPASQRKPENILEERFYFDGTSSIKDTASKSIVSPFPMSDNKDKTDRALHNYKNILAKSDVNNKMSTSNVIHSFKSPLPYKPDQWSPDRPDGRKIYDKDFLLALKNHPASQQKTKNILKPRFCFEVTSIIKDTDSKVIVSPFPMSDNRDKTGRTIHNDKNILAKSDVNNMSTEKVMHSFKSTLPYKPDQWAPDRPDGRKIYDRDFLLALKNHPASLQKPENILEQRFYFDVTRIIKGKDPKVIVSPIPMIDNRDESDRAVHDYFELPLPYKLDQWAPVSPNGRKMYDKDFLLALKNHPASQQRPENIPGNIMQDNPNVTRDDMVESRGSEVPSSVQSSATPKPGNSYEVKGGNIISSLSKMQSPLSSCPPTCQEISAPSPSVRKRKKERKAKYDEEQTNELLTVLEERMRAISDDQFAIFGKNVASKLKVLPIETRLYTEKLINGILFEAEMGNITKRTRIVSLSDDSQNQNTF